MNLKFDASSCVRATSKFSQCSKCLDICPVSTIEFANNIPAFTPSECTNCGACVGVCPTDAFSLDNFSSIDFFFNFLSSKEDELTCGVDMPCISVLGVDKLISLALASEKTLKINGKSCQCGGDKLKNQIEENIDEANYILSSFSDKQLINQAIKDVKPLEVKTEEEIDRRSFFSLKNALKSKESFDKTVDSDVLKEFDLDSETIKKMRDKNIPDGRKLIYSLFKRESKPQRYEVLASKDVSFISQKIIDDSCTNCQMCYRICPSGALSSNAKFSVINFEAMLCLKCHLCHDVCEPKAIKLTDGFNIKEFFEPSKKQLAEFDVRRCGECGNQFTYTDGEVMCNRCKIEENEALSLHGY